jgi:hypothetical protein
MGAWGTAISSNDIYADVYGSFFELFNAGSEVPEITCHLTQQFADTVADPDENHDFWFAVAKAQWECQQLDAEVLARVARIIESDDNIRVWQELDASTSDLKKRRAVLEKFLAQLQSERGSARKRKKKIIREPVFEKGECLTFRLSNGNYGGAVVLEAIKGTEYNYNLIATTRINQPTPPALADFERAELLVANYAGFDDKPSLDWYLPRDYKEVEKFIEIVGLIGVDVDYELNGSTFGYMFNFKLWVIDLASSQFESEQNKPGPTRKSWVKEFTKRSWWKFQL